MKVKEDKTGTYAVVLHTHLTGRVMVTSSSSDTTVATVSAALTFTTANWNVAQKVTVNGEKDPSLLVTGRKDRYATVNHQVSGYGGMTTAKPVRVTVEPPPIPPGLEISEKLVEVREGESKTYTVKLKTQPTGRVTVTPSSSDTTVATVSAALTFTTSNWNDAQKVTVNGETDDDAKNERVPVSHTATGAAEYDGINVDDVVVTVADPDRPGVTIVSADPLTVTEAEGTGNTATSR